MKKSRPPGGMLIFKLQFWMVLSVVMDSGTNAFHFHSRKLDNTIRRSEQRYSNHPIDSVYDSSAYPSNLKNSPSRPNFDKVENREFSSYPGSKIHELSSSDFDVLPSDTQFMRSYRNANDKSQFLNHTTIIAHLINGIYLQSGLINGKIPIDALVGELFNFGSVSVSDIINFKSDKVTALANKLKSVRDSLSNEHDADDVEKQALEWNGWLAKSESVINYNLDAIPNKAEYLKDVSSIISSKFFDSFKEVNDAYDEVQTQFDNIYTNGMGATSSKTSLSLLVTIFGDLGSTFKTYYESIGKLKNSINSLDSSYPWLKKGPEVFEPLEKMVDLMKSRNQKMIPSSDRIKVIKENVKKVLGPVEDAKSASRDVLTIESLTKHRANSQLKTVKHTEGFSNALDDLKQLVNDVRDPWIASILGLEIPKLNGISDGLQPLFGINGKIDGVNKKLKPISSNDFYNSLLNFKKLQTGASALSSESVGHADILNDYDSCTKKNVEAIAGDMNTEVGYIGNIRSLKNGLNSLPQVFEKIDVSKLKQETDNFVKNLGFKNLGDPVSTKSEIPAVLEKLKKSDELNKIKKFITEKHSAFLDFTTSMDLNAAATSIKNTGSTVPSDMFKKAITREKGFFDCVKKMSDKAEKLTQAVTVLQNLRTLQDKDIENVGLASSVVSELSKSLSNIKSIPETMKKDAKEVTTELNKMPDIEKNYKSIGQTVRYLQYAFALKQLEPSIPGLKNVEPVVQAEIHQISDLEQRKSIEQQWGDHRKHVTELENSIVKIKAYESKIDVSKAKTLGEYSSPLKEMVTLSDANINPNEKIKALEALIPLATDPKVKSELEEVKKTLESLSTLDLAFSSHNGQFQSAPGAFDAFHTFLTQFLTTNHSDPGAGTNNILTLPLAGGGFLLICLLLSTIYLICVEKRWERDRKSARDYWQTSIEENKDKSTTVDQRIDWAEAQKFETKEKAETYHQTIINMLDIQAEKSECLFGKLKNRRHKGKSLHRYDEIHCNPDTAVLYKKGPFYFSHGVKMHANWIKTHSGIEFIATEGPLSKEDGEAMNTVGNFWGMVMYYQTKYIVMLCDFMEYSPKHGEDKIKCGTYFCKEVGKSKKCGRFEVTTKSVESVFNCVIKRELEIVDTSFLLNCRQRFKTHTVIHYQYVGWPDHGAPKDHKDTNDLLNAVIESKTPIVVHCSAGVGRTVSLIAIQFVYDLIMRDHTLSMYDAVLRTREGRSRGVQKWSQSYWCQVAVVYKLWQKEKDETKKEKLGSIYHTLENLRRSTEAKNKDAKEVVSKA